MWNILFLVTVYSINQVNSYSSFKVKEYNQNGDLTIDPAKAVVSIGAHVKFTCSRSSKNAIFKWTLPPSIRSYEKTQGTSFSDSTLEPFYYSQITIFEVSSVMSGDIVCSVDDDDESVAIASLIVSAQKQKRDLKIEPVEAAIFAGTDVIFTCSRPSKNATFKWTLPPIIRSYEEMQGASFSNSTLEPFYYSQITIFRVAMRMSGDISCSVDDDHSTAVASLIVSGVPLGGECRTSYDCSSEGAECSFKKCNCPEHYASFPVIPNKCFKKIFYLYDPCNYQYQCTLMVDTNSVCNPKFGCVCKPEYKEENGRCTLKMKITTVRPVRKRVLLGGSCYTSSDCLTFKAVCSNRICECPSNYHYVESVYGICREMDTMVYTDVPHTSSLNGKGENAVGYICIIVFIIVLTCCGLIIRACHKQRTFGPSTATQIDNADNWTAQTDTALQNRSTQINNIDHWTTQTDNALQNRRTQNNALQNRNTQIDSSSQNRRTQINSTVQNRRTQIDSADQNRTIYIDNADSLPVNIINDKPPSYEDVIVSEDTMTDPPNYNDALEQCMTEGELL